MEVRGAVGISVLSVLLFEIYSALSNNVSGNKWAVLIAGSTEWVNYRHQADVCHAYHVLRDHGIPKENIITFMYDDIAHSAQNPYPGQIFNNPEMVDVYDGVIIDYRGDTITKENIFNVLLGTKAAMKGIGSGRVLESGPNDHVFIYYTDHGNPGIIGLPHNNYITYTDLIRTLESMKSSKQYKHLLFYMESCYSGSMFSTLPKNINIFATTAANANQESMGCYCNVPNLPCIGDSYSVSWIENTKKENVNSETVIQQFEIVKNETTRSEVCHFGDESIYKITIGQFLGSRNMKPKDKPEPSYDRGVQIPSGEHDFYMLLKQVQATEPGSLQERQLVSKMKSTLEDMKNVHQKFDTIADTLSPTRTHFDEVITARHAVQRESGQCFNTVLETLMKNCFTNNEKQYIFKHTQKIINLCSRSDLSEEEISYEITHVCQTSEQEKVELSETENCWMGPNVCNIFCSAKGRQAGIVQSGSCANSENKCICLQNSS